MLRHPRVAVPSRITPLAVVGLLRARRGEGDPWEPLDEALALARRTAELQRLAPVAAARAEARWLEGDMAAVRAETDDALGLTREQRDAAALGELWTWRRRADVDDTVEPELAGAPYVLESRGEPLAAAERWEDLRCPYQAALARLHSADVAALRHALEAFARLGARAAAQAASRRLRQRGVRGVARGPRRSTRTNPAQLTPRQLEILRMLGDHLSNVEIARRLYLSPRTVDHHVSAILGKLGVPSRAHAAAEAVRLGIAQR